MAITQYTQINNRSGLQRDLPQLSTAELGWSIDSRRLFIGNGTLAEGAPEVGNTELLTEYSDIFALADAYSYKGAQAGYTVNTSPVFAQAEPWSAGVSAIRINADQIAGVSVGQMVIGPGIAPSTFVTAITSMPLGPGEFYFSVGISNATTRAITSSISLAFIGGSLVAPCFWTADYTTSLIVGDATGIQTDMNVTGENVPSNLQVSAISQPISVTANCTAGAVGTNYATLDSTVGIVVGSEVTVATGSGQLPGGTYVISIQGNTVLFAAGQDIIADLTGSTLQFTYYTLTMSNNLGLAPASPVQLTFHADTARTLQEKLDDTVSVRDFGAVGNGSTDDTAAINNALNQLYCVSPYNTAEPSAPLVRRILLFPAGRYIVSSALLIPPNCTLSGEGKGHTVIQFNDRTITDITGTWDFFTASNEITVSAKTGLEIGQIVTGDGIAAGTTITGIADDENVITVSLPVTGVAIDRALAFATGSDYVARTASSLQEYGAGIDTTAGLNPQDILIRDMTFENPRTTLTQDIFLVERAERVRFERVGFVGSGSTTVPVSGVALNQTGEEYSIVYPTRNISFEACQFVGMEYGIRSSGISRNSSGVYSTQNISVTNGQFVDLRLGIFSNTDDYSWIIMNNTMDQVLQEGLRFDVGRTSDGTLNTNTFTVSGQMITTGHNIFLDVAGGSVPVTNVIYFYNRNCLSVGDMFARTDEQAQIFARIYINTQSSIVFQGTQAIALGQRILNTSVTSPIAADTDGVITIPGGLTQTGNSVTSLVFSSRGSGYQPDVPPAITISANPLPGVQATATAVIGRQLANTAPEFPPMAGPNSGIISGGTGWSGNVSLTFTPPTIIGDASILNFNGTWSNGSAEITLSAANPNVYVGGVIAGQGIPLNAIVGNVAGNVITAIYSTNSAPITSWPAAGNNQPVSFGYGILNGQGARGAVAAVAIAKSVTNFVVSDIGRGYPANFTVNVAPVQIANTSTQTFANCLANAVLKGFGLAFNQGNYDYANSNFGNLSIGSGYMANSVVPLTMPRPQAGNTNAPTYVTGSWSTGTVPINITQGYSEVQTGGQILTNLAPYTGSTANVVVGNIVYRSQGDVIYPVYQANSEPVYFNTGATDITLQIIRSITVANGFANATAAGVVAYGVDNGFTTYEGANFSRADNDANLYTVTFSLGTYTARSYPARAKPYLGFPLLNPGGITLTAGGNNYATMPNVILDPAPTGINTYSASIRVFANVVAHDYDSFAARGNGYSIGDLVAANSPGAGANANVYNANISVANIYAAVHNISLTANGSGYVIVPTLTFAAPNVTTNTATGNTTAQMVSITANRRGFDYSAGEGITMIGGDGINAQVTVTTTSIGQITFAANNVSDPSKYGANLFVGNIVTLQGGNGIYANVIVDRLRISPYPTATYIVNPGSGYAVGQILLYGNTYGQVANIRITAVDGNSGIANIAFNDYGNFSQDFRGDAGNITGGNATGTNANINFSFGCQTFTLNYLGNYTINGNTTDVPANVAGAVPYEDVYFDVRYQLGNFIVANTGNYITTLPPLSNVQSVGNRAGIGATFDPSYGVRSIRLLSGGTGYYNNNAPVVTVGGNGNGAVVTANLNRWGAIADSTVSNAGGFSQFPANIRATPLATIAGANACAISQTAVVNLYMGVQSLQIANAGQGYQAAPTVSFTGFYTSNTYIPTANATAYTNIANVGGVVVDIDLRPETVGTSPPPPGAGYITPPTFTVTGPNVTPARGNTTLTTVGNLFFDFSNIGAGYSIPYDGQTADDIRANITYGPNIGPGSGANIRFVYERPDSYSLLSAGVYFDGLSNTVYSGNGYLTPPQVTAQPNTYPGVVQPVVTAVLSPTGQLANMRFIDRGYGYTQLPQVYITTDGLYGTSADIALSLETEGNVFVSGLLGGSGYDANVPTVTITGGTGSGANATATVGEYQQPLIIDTRANPSTLINYAVRITDGGNVYSRSGILNITGGQTYDPATRLTNIQVQSDDDFTENYESGFQLTVTAAPGNSFATIGYDNTNGNSLVGNGAGTMKFYIDQIVDYN